MGLTTLESIRNATPALSLAQQIVSGGDVRTGRAGRRYEPGRFLQTIPLGAPTPRFHSCALGTSGDTLLPIPCSIYFSAYFSWSCLIPLWNCWFSWPSQPPVAASSRYLLPAVKRNNLSVLNQFPLQEWSTLLATLFCLSTKYTFRREPFFLRNVAKFLKTLFWGSL